MVSCARCLGRIKGTSIEVFIAESAIVVQSVLRMILSKKRHSSAASKVYCIKSFPLSGFMFFPGTPFEPDRAGIIHRFFIFEL